MNDTAKMLGVASLLAIAGAGTTAAQESRAYSTYIAFGDSFSSGVGATTWKAGDPCIRSDAGWTGVLDASLGAPPFVQAACSGATSEDILAQGPKFEQQGGISQIALLPPPEQLKGALITIQVGGNDIRHDSECLAGLGLGNGEHGPNTEACASLADAAANVAETIAEVGIKLDYLYQNIQALAPEATIVAIGYPHLVNARIPDCDLSYLGITDDLKVAANALVDAGNWQIKQTASNLGIAAITDEIAIAFDDHEVCSKEEWIVSPNQLRDLSPEEITRGGHPNDEGHRQIAALVLSLLPTLTTRNGTVIPEEGGETEEQTPEGERDQPDEP